MKGKPALMLQGTCSDAGKSTLSAGLCRLFTRRGLTVRPFKPQNMSNNAAVTEDGGEIGRAQALQARACRVAATTDMNPVLLKPESERGSQIILQGKAWGTAGAANYKSFRAELMQKVMESYARLEREADLMIIEGAGSISEVNLREGDIANMGFALQTQVPVVIVADVDRGGVIASLVGSHALLTEQERELVSGYIINKFRGDLAIFAPALSVIEQRTGMPCFGVAPWFPGAAAFPAEDSLSLGRRDCQAGDAGGKIRIRVLSLPHISNFDDFDPLAAEPDVDLAFVPPGEALPGDVDLVIIPGSKATIADLAELRRQGWDIDIMAHRRRGGRVLGICGGYQMLGEETSDPLGLESCGRAQSAPGLNLLAVTTELAPAKTLRQLTGRTAEGDDISAYEIHCGVTSGPGTAQPMLQIDGRGMGAKSHDGLVQGCYLHGLFSSDSYRTRFLAELRQGRTSAVRYDQEIEKALDDLADLLETSCDIKALASRAGISL